ncbi:MAG TPA: TIGR03936 family radical SAM-associated protein, partial [Polyangiaceae bacterium]
RLDVWQEALSHFEIDTSRFLGTIPVTARLPWDHIDVGLEDGFLAREYRKALASRLSPPCGKVKGMFVHHTNMEDASKDARRLVCYDCGVACDLGKMRDQRMQFLTKMGADKPGERARLPVVQMPEAGAGPPKRRAPEAYRPPQAGGEPERFRLRFQKTGPAALLGHLDLIRELPRIVRRAGVRTAYTRGFHPKPDMTFSPALSLGVASLEEYLDVRLIGAPGTDELLVNLNRVAAGGVAFSAATRLGPNDPRVTSLIDGAHYVVALARPAIKAHGGIQRLEEQIAAFHAAESVLVKRVIEGIGKIVEVKNFVTDVRLGGADALDSVRKAGIVGDLVPIEVRVRVLGSGSVKIAEVIEAVTGDRTLPFKAVRVALTSGATSPMDLLAHRREPPVAAARKMDPSVVDEAAGGA